MTQPVPTLPILRLRLDDRTELHAETTAGEAAPGPGMATPRGRRTNSMTMAMTMRSPGTGLQLKTRLGATNV